MKNISNKGAALTEYAILAALIGVVSVSSVIALGTTATGIFTSSSNELENAIEIAATPTGDIGPSTNTVPTGPATTSWTGEGKPLCIYMSTWGYSENPVPVMNAHYSGIHTVGGPSGTPQQQPFAVWFGPNPQGTTPGGKTVWFVIPDLDGDGFINEVEANLGASSTPSGSFDVVASVSENALGLLPSSQPRSIHGASALLFANQVFNDNLVNPYYASLSGGFDFFAYGGDFTIDGDDIDGDGIDEANNDKISPMFPNEGTNWLINPDLLKAPDLEAGC